MPFAGPVDVSASIDDVYINDEAVPYDDFGGSAIDISKWNMNTSRIVRIVENNGLRLSAQGRDRRTTSQLKIINEDLKYIEAKVSVQDGTYVSAGGSGRVRIGGEYYNDSHGPGSGIAYNGSLGEVWAETRMSIQDSGNLVASAGVARADDPDWITDTSLFHHIFSTPIQKNSIYVLSIEFTGSQFIFKCNNEKTSYNISTPTFEPNYKGQYLTSRLYLDPGEQGLFDAVIGDVYVAGSNMAPLNVLMLGD